MNQENVYHYIENTSPSPSPFPSPSNYNNYDLNLNPNIFPNYATQRSHVTQPQPQPQRSQQYAHQSIHANANEELHSKNSRLRYATIPGTRQPQYTQRSDQQKRIYNPPQNQDVLARMNQDFQQFAQNIGFNTEKSMLANHLDIPVQLERIDDVDAQHEKSISINIDDVQTTSLSIPSERDDNKEISKEPVNQPDNRASLQRSVFGEQRLPSYSYPAVYKDEPFMQLPQLNLINNPKPRYLHVDSRNRNRERYPNPNNYVYPLVSSSNDVDTPGVVYKNVFQIRLTSAVIPNINAPLDLPYIILAIDEIEGIYDASTPQCKRAFGKLLFCGGTGKFLRLDTGISDGIVRTFWPSPLASLSKLSLCWLKPDGSLFNWGTDNAPPNPINEDLQNSLTFEIITEVPDVRQAIGHRNP